MFFRVDKHYFSPMQFKRGDRVKFLNDQGEGTVMAFPQKGWVLVEDQEGFTYEHPEEDLVLVGDWNKEYDKYAKTHIETIEILERNVDKNIAKKAEDNFNVLYKNRATPEIRKKGDSIEVDLHIHALLDRYDKMSNAEIIQIQIEHFERTLKLAEEKKVHRVVYIHGVGQGVLRAEIRKILNQYYPNCTFMDGPYNEYGYGATEVRMKKFGL